MKKKASKQLTTVHGYMYQELSSSNRARVEIYLFLCGVVVIEVFMSYLGYFLIDFFAKSCQWELATQSFY